MTLSEDLKGKPTSLLQDAVRLLLLVDAASEPVPDPRPERAPEDAVAVLLTQVRLQKLDFWLRNPDYLANELLTRFETEGDPDNLADAERILDSDEPEVRRYPMLRHLFGAFEELDEALSLLATPRLVLQRRRHDGLKAPTDYYLTSAGRQTAQQVVREAPPLRYYVDRAALVADLAEGRRGTQLRDIQYLQQEYRDAAMGSRIGGIAARARERLVALRSAHTRGLVQ